MNITKIRNRVEDISRRLNRENDVKDFLVVLDLAKESGENFLGPDSLVFWAVKEDLISQYDAPVFLDWIMVEI